MSGSPRERGKVRATQKLWLGCLLIFLVALGVRIVYVNQLASTPFIDERPLMADSRYYEMRAREIGAGEWRMYAPGFLSPLYCYALGAVYAVLGPGLYGAKLFQAVVGALSCALLVFAGRRLFSNRAGWLAGLMLAFYAPHIYYHGLLLPPTLIVFLHLSILVVLTGLPSPGRGLVGGLLIGLATIAKANAILLVPVAVVAILLDTREGMLRKRWAEAAALVLVAVLVLTPITVANYRLSGSFFLVTTTGGSNLLKGNGPTATGTHAFLPPGTQATGLRMHMARSVDAVEAVRQSRELSARARSFMLEHPLEAGLLFGKKLLLLFNAQETGIRDQYYFAKTQVASLRWPFLAFWAVVPLGMAGACLAWREWRRLALPYGILAVQVVSFVLIFVLARYRLVLVACLMPFAAWAILQAIEQVRTKNRGRFLSLLVPFAVFLAIAFVPFPGHPRDSGYADQYAFLANHHIERQDYEQAADYYEAALSSTWQDERNLVRLRWNAQIGLARARTGLGQADAARDILVPLLGQMETAPRNTAVGEMEQVRRLLEEIDAGEGKPSEPAEP